MAENDKVILTNKENGDVIHVTQRYDTKGAEGFMVTIPGTKGNGFFFARYSEWDIEEVKPPYTLPTELGVYMASSSVDDDYYPEMGKVPILYILDNESWWLRWSYGEIEKRTPERILTGIGRDTLVKLVPETEED